MELAVDTTHWSAQWIPVRTGLCNPETPAWGYGSAGAVQKSMEKFKALPWARKALQGDGQQTVEKICGQGPQDPVRQRVLSPAVSQAKSTGHVVAQVIGQVKGPSLFNWHYSV